MGKRVSRRRVLGGVVIVGAVVIGVFGPSEPVAAHGGGLDGYGCHNDRKAGTYHCHRGPCQGRRFASKTEMIRDKCSKSQR